MRRFTTMLAAAAALALALAAGTAVAQEVKVGIVLPYTGIGAQFGQQMDRGMEMYLKLNAASREALHDQADQARRQEPGRRRRQGRGAGAA